MGSKVNSPSAVSPLATSCSTASPSVVYPLAVSSLPAGQQLHAAALEEDFQETEKYLQDLMARINHLANWCTDQVKRAKGLHNTITSLAKSVALMELWKGSGNVIGRQSAGDGRHIEDNVQTQGVF